MRRRGGPFFLLLNILFVFSAEAADKPLPKIVAEVNQAHITNLAVEAKVRSYLRKIGHKELSPFRMAVVEKDALKKLIEEELLYQEGLRFQQSGTESELAATEAEIEAGIRGIQNRFPSQQTYEDSLLKEGLSMNAVRKGIKRSLLIQKTWEVLSSMSNEERSKRLKSITKSAVIQIHPHPVTDNGERLATTSGRR